MKLRTIITATILFVCASAWARNNIKTITRVDESITLTEDVDYVITGAEPFGAMGSVNIENVEHAVVIIKNIRPSKVISSWLNKHIYINGVQAVDGTNCQVRMYNRGAIIFPYSKTIRPLVVFQEKGFQGDSYDNYSEGHSGGFMKTLTAKSFRNGFKSMKLKRGYMVTLAVGAGGWGYSRCFIADQEDLEIDLPHPLCGKVSSYRLFKWWNASKAGVHDTGKEANAALRTTSCFDWAQGESSLLPDVEWVPNHIYEDWPSASACGSVDGSCHMKTNNEPGNAKDDHPQDVETVLNNWQNLMRTGMRLCSESSHDGSMDHLRQFMEAIDARGWRCDILDLHCYWADFGNLNNVINNYGKGRPCWISEWVWGASWNNNGAFASGRQNDEATYNGTKPILDMLNSNPLVERYYYWNSEAWYTQIYRDNALTKLGQYYADMEVGLGYNPSYDYAPKIVFKAPSELVGSYTLKTKKLKLTWTDPNGDMLDSIVVERLKPGTTDKWLKVGNVSVKDKTSADDLSYTYNEVFTETGTQTFRVTEYYIGPDGSSKRNFSTNTVSLDILNVAGVLEWGNITLADTTATTVDFFPMLDVDGNTILDKEGTAMVPNIIMGVPSYTNTANAITNQLMNATASDFKFRFQPWRFGTKFPCKNSENVNLMILPTDTVMHLSDEMMLISGSIGTMKAETEQTVVFPEAFPEGTTPVVLTQHISSNLASPSIVVRIYDVTNTGFKCIMERQEGELSTPLQDLSVSYYACSQGEASIGCGKKISAILNTANPVGGSKSLTVLITDKDGEKMTIINPMILAQPQTHNYGKATALRLSTSYFDNIEVDGTTYSSLKQVIMRRHSDSSNTSCTDADNAAENGDNIGFIIISDDIKGNPEDAPVIVRRNGSETGIHTTKKGFALSTVGGIISSNQTGLKAYNAAGQFVPLGQRLPSGIYFVTDGKVSTKVVIR